MVPVGCCSISSKLWQVRACLVGRVVDWISCQPMAINLDPRQQDLHAAERELESLHAQLAEAPAENWGWSSWGWSRASQSFNMKTMESTKSSKFLLGTVINFVFEAFTPNFGGFDANDENSSVRPCLRRKR